MTTGMSSMNSYSTNIGKLRREGMGLPKGYSDSRSRYICEMETLSGLPNTQQPYLVLGIETSCDDTGVAIVSSNGSILADVVYSQSGIHENFGGIVPSLAMEAHKSNIDIAINKALTNAGLTLSKIDAIAVTKGPGLEICLRVGCRKAQEIAREYNLPFVTVHHLEAHCLLARLTGVEMNEGNIESRVSLDSTVAPKEFQPKVNFPFLALLVSGGHTSILLCRGLGDYTVLGATLDDSLGEAFDKASRLLGLRTAGCGGAAVEIAARQGNSQFKTSMSVPMKDKINCDFSYSGLKNAFRLEVRKAREQLGLDITTTNAPVNQMEELNQNDVVTLPDQVCADLCAAFQEVAFAHVEDRIKRALDYIEENGISVDSLVVVGGVASNLELRRKLLKLLDARYVAALKQSVESDGQEVTVSRMKLIFPPPQLCTDNGVMAAWAGIEKLNMGISNSVENQEVIARWPLGSPLPRPPESNRKKNKQQKFNPTDVSGNETDAEAESSMKPFQSKNARRAKEKLLAKLRHSSSSESQSDKSSLE